MPVKVKVTVKGWRGKTAINAINARLARGVAMAAADVAQLAAGKAPVSTRRAGARASRVPDVAVQPIRKGADRTRRGDVGEAIAAIESVDAELLGKFEFRVAPVFRHKPQARAGEAVDASSVFIKRGRLFAGGAHQPGTLKRNIKVVSVEVGGHQVKARVAALVKYAAAQEYGFAHKGGRNKKGKVTRVPARKPFMRPALAEISEPYRTGKYFKG